MMPLHFTFAVGLNFTLNGIRYSVIDIKGDTIKAERECDLVVRTFDTLALLNSREFLPEGWDQPTPNKPLAPDREGPAALSQHQEEIVAKRLSIIDPMILLKNTREGDVKSWDTFLCRYPHLVGDHDPRSITLSSLVKHQASRHKVGTMTLWRYWKQYKEGGPEALSSSAGTGVHQRPDNRSIRIIHPTNKKVLDTVVCRLNPEQIRVVEGSLGRYCTRFRPSVSEIVEEIVDNCDREGVKPPSQRTLRSLLKRANQRIIDKYRLSPDEFSTRHDMERIGAARSYARYPGQVFGMDHSPVDVFVIDDRTGAVIGRPLLTLVLDEYSRMPAGVSIGFEEHSVDRVKDAVLHAILPKCCREMYGTEHEWSVHCIPAVWRVDNALEFRSKEFLRISRVMNSEIKFRPRKTPQADSIIERMIRTADQKVFHRLPGSSKSRPEDLHGYRPMDDACITLDDLIRIVMIYLVDKYPFERHQGLPSDSPTPWLMLQKGLSEHGGLRWQVPASEAGQWLLSFMQEVELSLGSHGVRHDNIFYWAPLFESIRRAGAKKLRVKIDNRDVSHCFFYDPASSRWFEASAQQPSAHTLRFDRFVWKRVQAYAKTEGESRLKGIAADETVIKAQRKIRQITEESRKNALTRRKESERLRSGQLAPVPSVESRQPRLKRTPADFEVY